MNATTNTTANTTSQPVTTYYFTRPATRHDGPAAIGVQANSLDQAVAYLQHFQVKPSCFGYIFEGTEAPRIHLGESILIFPAAMVLRNELAKLINAGYTPTEAAAYRRLYRLPR